MKMTSLEQLHRSMREIPTEVQKFSLTLGAAEFACLFTTRTTAALPYFGLSLTSKGANPVFVLFDVKPGYYISPSFDTSEVYNPLRDVLRSHGKSGKLYPVEFLKQLNDAIPKSANRASIPTSNQIVALRPDIVEDRDKVHFWYWKPWPITDEPGPPSNENKHKTLMLLGEAALRQSIHTNSSSCWTADESKAKHWESPEL